MKNQIRAIAIDDEPLALRQISTYISRTPSLELVAQCSSAEEALKVLSGKKVDAVFMDINMPGMSGIEAARHLSDGPMIVFTTAYSEYAVEGFRVNAVDYLLKPISFADFTESVHRLEERLRLKESGNAEEKYLTVKSEYKLVRLKVSDILYAESMGEYMKIWSAGEGEDVCTLVLMTVFGLLDLLPKGDFIRIHRSYIVNTAEISELKKGFVALRNGKILPVGDTYKTNVLNLLNP